MAKSVPAGNGANAAFNRAVASASNPAGAPGGISVPSEAVQAAYESGYVGGTAFMGTPDIFAGLNAPRAGARSGKFFDQQTISTYNVETDEQRIAKKEALEEMGLAANQFSYFYLDPMSPEDSAWQDRFDAAQELEDSGGPTNNLVVTPGKGAGLTDIPTSTTNYARPRTVAAGWSANTDGNNNVIDPAIGTLTVVFRDGTLVNYYDVPRAVWIKFHNSISKGRSFLNHANSVNPNEGTLLAYRYGPVSIEDVDPDIRDEMQDAIYLAARTKQIYYRQPKNGPGHYQYVYRKQTDGSVKRTRIKTYGSPQGPYTGNTNPATNRKIAQGEAAARAAKAKAGSAPKVSNSAQKKK